jgi:uncharacterized membrane protein HdeD (DUF308 family)
METENNNTSTELQPTTTTPKMVSQVGNIILSAIMAILGLTFISLCDRHDQISQTILILGGIAFVLPGVTVLLSLLVNRNTEKEAAQRSQSPAMSLLMIICGVAAVALGIVILVVPDVFKPLLVYLFGALLILSAAWQFNLMMRRNRETLYPIWLEVAPILIVVLGVVMMTLDTFSTNEKALVLATGIGFTLFGLIGLSISYIALKARSAAKKLTA